MKMKKVLMFLGIALIAVALVGCGGNDVKKSEENDVEQREEYDLSTPDGTVKEIIRAYNEGDWDHLKELTIGGDQFFADREAFLASLPYDEESTALLNEKLQFIELVEMGEVTQNEFAEGVTFVEIETRSYDMGAQMINDATDFALAGDGAPISQDFADVETFLFSFNVNMLEDGEGWKLDLTWTDLSFTNNEPLADLLLGNAASSVDDWIVDNKGTAPVPTQEVAVGDYNFTWPA